ncbi:uncharacterized protein LOC126377474 [Pectinophora gossypiella]|uniref:uncharacterized protein LOC126377474 n=1 Tax=Pectinophora gossypiella TaxID=13191 RepID=UPI00214E8157|nr:uncharacterized protein LOC126377474 [Pectinophora gossypiella]
MPIADVLLHPEYKHFGAKNSIALMKLLKSVSSQYVLPVCLPFKNFIMRRGRQTTEKLYHIDYANDVPRDLITEEKEVQKLSLLPRELCYLYDEQPENSTSFVKNRMACSTGCGMHSGAPSLVHEKTGHWSVVAIAIGGSSCPDPLRPRRPPSPPRHILIHPYVPWITAAIAGKAVGAFAKDDPFGFMMPRASLYDFQGFHKWIGHWWMGGPRCQDRGDAADDLMRFYHEIFQVQPATHTRMDYYLEIDAALGTLIVCVKVGMPYKLGQPKVWELDTPVVRVKIPVIPFSNTYRMQIEAWAYNTTESSDSGGEEENECDSAESEGCSQ